MRNDRASILGHFQSCHGQVNLVRFSSIIKCYRHHENQLIVFDRAVVKQEKKMP